MPCDPSVVPKGSCRLHLVNIARTRFPIMLEYKEEWRHRLLASHQFFSRLCIRTSRVCPFISRTLTSMDPFGCARFKNELHYWKCCCCRIFECTSLQLMNLLMPCFSMNLTKNFASNYVTSPLESAAAAILPVVTASMGTDPSLVLGK